MWTFLVAHWYMPFFFFCLLGILANLDTLIEITPLFIIFGITISLVFLFIKYSYSIKYIVLYSAIVYIPGMFLTVVLGSILKDLYMDFQFNNVHKQEK